MIEMMLPSRAVSESEIVQFERAHNLALPEDYRRFLRNQNGGRPQDGDFPVPDWGVTVIDFFFGIGTDDSYDLQQQCDRLEAPRRSELLPIR